MKLKIFSVKTGECLELDTDKINQTRREKLRRKIVSEALKHDLYKMITLSINYSNLPPEVCPACYLKRCSDLILKRLRRAFQFSYISIVEHGQDKRNVHLHILTNIEAQSGFIGDAWRAVGGGKCHLRYVKSGEIARLSGYASKSLSHKHESKRMKGRCVMCSRDISLAGKKEDTQFIVENETSRRYENGMCSHGYYIIELERYFDSIIENKRNYRNSSNCGYNRGVGKHLRPVSRIQNVFAAAETLKRCSVCNEFSDIVNMNIVYDDNAAVAICKRCRN